MVVLYFECLARQSVNYVAKASGLQLDTWTKNIPRF